VRAVQAFGKCLTPASFFALGMAFDSAISGYFFSAALFVVSALCFARLP
jgi:hypothetical protein